MGINRDHPKYLEFIKKEHKTLEFLYRNAFMAKTFPDLAKNAELTFYRYQNLRDKQLEKVTFLFSSNFNLVIEGKTMRIIVEAQVSPGYNLVSYALSICDTDSTPFPLLRKFHFDYALPMQNDPWPKPVYHIQYGGKQTPGLAELGINDTSIIPWLSSPRLYWGPINLAILLDLIFCEFRSIDTTELIQRREWRELLKNNEEFLLKPFYEKLRTFFLGQHKFFYLLRDYQYGN